MPLLYDAIAISSGERVGAEGPDELGAGMLLPEASATAW